MAEAVDEVEELLQVDGIIEAGRGVNDVEDAGRLAEGAGEMSGEPSRRSLLVWSRRASPS